MSQKMADLIRETTPAQLLSLRLVKLEKDLELLTGMQTLLLSSGVQLTSTSENIADNVPERDTPRAPPKAPAKAFKLQRPAKGTTPAQRPAKQLETEAYTNTHIEKLHKSTETDECDGSLGSLELLEALRAEREKRLDVEESARRVSTELRQVQDELSKERETKQMLLVGTLQLKNQISSQESHIRECESQINQLKTEIQTLQQSLADSNTERRANAKKLKDLIDALKGQKRLLQTDNTKLLSELKNMSTQVAEQKQQLVLKEQSLQSLEQKHVTQMNQMATKYAQVDKERQDLAVELRNLSEKCDASLRERDEMKSELTSIKNECERNMMLKDCLMNKLKSDLTLQKEQFEAQIKNSQEVISKTKTLILQVRQERDELKDLLTKCEANNKELGLRGDGAVQNYKNLMVHYENFKSKIKTALGHSHEHLEKLKKENSNLKSLVATLRKEKSAQSERLLASENEFLREKSGFEERLKSLEGENETLRSELSRCMDNFRVLQKVSQDQTQTIQTLRGEKEEQRKIKFQLESQLREGDANEAGLARKLEQEQRRSARLEESLEEYQKRLSALEEELREHNCEEYVETSLKIKLKQMEYEVKERYEEWQQALDEARGEKERAQREARNYQKIAEEVKSDFESQLMDVNYRSKQEIQRLKTESKRNLADRMAKILELETELEQSKTSANQIQQNLYAKIKQLQCALSACVASTIGSGLGGTGMSAGPNPFSNFL